MKKILAIVLALLMMASLFACASQTPASSASPAASKAPSAAPSAAASAAASTAPSAAASASAAPSATTNPKGAEIGMYNPNYDYSKNPKYKVQYVVLATQGLYEAFSDAFKHWAGKMNIEYLGMKEFGGDKDAYISNLPTLAKAADGLLVDPDSQMYTRVNEIMKETGKPYMGCMAAPRNYEDKTAPLLNPYVGFNHYEVGTYFPPKLLEYKEKLWKDVPLSKFGFITVDFSVAPPLHDRERGAKDTLAKIAPDLLNRYFVADTAIKTFDVDTSSQVVSAVLAKNPNIQYWLVWAEVDDMAKGAAAALDQAGLTKNSCVMTFGGTGLQIQWDAGQEDAWRAALYLPQTIYAEPIIGALYAFMSKQATPDTLWPNWVNANDKGGASHNYASRMLPFYWIEHDTYKKMIKWSDIYAGSNYFAKYPAEGITRDTFSTTVPVPATYKAK